MRTHALRNGDLDLIGDRFAMVEGAARVQQQLGLCIREVWGIDRFHPGWGSVMPNWIGGVISGSLELDLRSEVLRIVKNQMSAATDAINRRANASLRPVVVAGEIITNVSNIVVRQAQDQIFVRVVFVTASNAQFSLIIKPGGAA